MCVPVGTLTLGMSVPTPSICVGTPDPRTVSTHPSIYVGIPDASPGVPTLLNISSSSCSLESKDSILLRTKVKYIIYRVRHNLFDL